MIRLYKKRIYCSIISSMSEYYNSYNKQKVGITFWTSILCEADVKDILISSFDHLVADLATTLTRLTTKYDLTMMAVAV
jgi:hypothetical protein